MKKCILLIVFSLIFLSQIFANDKMVNGTNVNPTNSSVVLLTFLDQSHCSGVVLAPDWIMTAAHCFNVSRNVSDFKVQMANKTREGNADSESVAIDKIFIHDNYQSENPEWDFALIKVNRYPFFPKLGGANYDSAWNIRPWWFDASSLINKAVTCYGYGRDENNRIGVLKYGKFYLSGASEAKFKLTKAGPSTFGSGDSGGPCFLNSNTGGNVYLGVISATNNLTGTAVLEIAAIANARYWVLEKMYGSPFMAPIGDRVEALAWDGNDYMKMPVFPASVNSNTIWNPCPGSKYDLNAEMMFGEFPGDKATVSTSEVVQTPYCGMFGCGVREEKYSRYYEYTGNASLVIKAFGGVGLSAYSDSYGTFPGFKSVTASCDLGVKCFGDHCFTVAHKDINGVKGGGIPSKILPANFTTDYVWWNPCNGGCYNYRGESDFEQNYVGYAQIFQYKSNGALEPKNTFMGKGVRTGRLCGGAYLQVSTRQFSVNNKSFSISAVCEAY